MADGGNWNRAGRKSGGDRTPVFVVNGRRETKQSLDMDEAFLRLLLDYSDAKRALYDCDCEGECPHHQHMTNVARDIADHLVADPAPIVGTTPAGLGRKE